MVDDKALPLNNKIMRKAFTLTEMALVLVIIGIITAGVFIGQNLIKNSNLNKLTQETNKFRTAFQSFYTIYDAYPGDFADAYNIWGSQSSCTDHNVNSTATGCNGDQDGEIESTAEGYRAIQHLALAKLIQGSFNGTNENYISKYENYLYSPPQSCSDAGRSTFGKHCHLLGDADDIDDPGLAPIDLEKIDYKIDDGIPTNGKVGFSVVLGVVTTSSCGDSTYVNSETLGCNYLYSFD